MTISAYITILDREYDALLGLDDDGELLVVSNAPLPRSVATALAGYAPQLKSYFILGNRDTDLSLGQMAKELRALGFIRFETGVWGHVDGDEVGDHIVAGIIDLDDQRHATRSRAQRADQFVRALRDRH
jgi:hypothetical protein